MIFDAAMALDCNAEKNDAVKELVDAVRQVYIGVPLPEAVTTPPPEDHNARKLSMEVAMMILKYLQ